mgnify:CR=1 FL=1
MVDVAYGPEPGPRRKQGSQEPFGTEAYLAMVRRKRMYGGILLILFVAMMAAGFQLADGRNAGGFWDGLHRLGDFPSEVLAEAWRNRANIPGLFWQFLPSLIETLNIAAVATVEAVIA